MRRQPTHRIAHLSDTHINGDGALFAGVIDTRARLRAALRILTSWNLRCDAWVFSGDLSDDGSPESYAWLAEHVGEAAGRLGVPVIWAAGNHDDRACLRAGLLGGVASDEPVVSAHDVRGLRVLVIDTSVPGSPAGEVDAATLAWLGDALATPAPAGSIVVAHHAPLPIVQDAAWGWALRNPDALGAVVAGRDVRAIVSGHFHQSMAGTLAGVPVQVATALASTQDVAAGRDLIGVAAHPGFSLVEVYAETVVHTVVPLTPADPLPGLTIRASDVTE